MKRKTGFTLIELLAVIVILAIIALIATPLIMRTINDAKDGVLKSTLRNIIHVAETEYAKNLSTGTESPNIKFEDLKYKGEKFDAGVLKYDKNGNAYIAVYKTNKCVYKGEGDTDVSIIKDITLDECMEKVNGGSKKLTVADIVAKANDASITNYTDGKTGEMYTFTHDSATEYRYIGSNPNNYIIFNDETWRIIGVFDGQIKIIRDDYIGKIDLTSQNIEDNTGLLEWDSAGTNNWSTSSLQRLLNENTSDVWSLNARALAQVSDSTWYLGMLSEEFLEQAENNEDELSIYKNTDAQAFYNWERGDFVYEGNPTTWAGKVGLIYPSDYHYTFAYGVDENCSTWLCGLDMEFGTSSNPSESWLFKSDSSVAKIMELSIAKMPEWTISPFPMDSEHTVSIDYYGSTLYGAFNFSTTTNFAVRPTVYLKKGITLVGNGTKANPYTISDADYEKYLDSLKTTVKNIITSAEKEYKNNIKKSPDSLLNLKIKDLKYDGEEIEDGLLAFDKDGNAAVAVYMSGVCIYKTDSSSEVTYNEKMSSSDCLALAHTNSTSLYSIKLKGDSTTVVALNETYEELGYTILSASGKEISKENVNETIKLYKDGNEVSEIITTEIGEYTIKYTVEYSNVTIISERIVQVKDVTPPVITVLGKTSDFGMSHTSGYVFTVPTASATDNVDKNVSVKVSSTVNPTVVGTYKVTYTATDSSGNITTLVITVNVKSSGASDLAKKTNSASITNYADGNTGEMYTFTHEATEQTPALTDYRYIGSNPNNYITFNDETWRIIGVFYVDDEWKIKIMRDTSIGTLAWNSEDENDWVTSSLQLMLNGVSDKTTLTSETASSNWSLSDKALSYVSDSTWYLGAAGDYDSLPPSYPSASPNDTYIWERGTETYRERAFEWKGKVALIYPSDYYYTYAYGVDDSCYNDPLTCGKSSSVSNSWIQRDMWTLSPALAWTHKYGIYDGSLASLSYSYSSGTYPSVYLKSDIKLSGAGTESNPYVIVD